MCPSSGPGAQWSPCRRWSARVCLRPGSIGEVLPTSILVSPECSPMLLRPPNNGRVEIWFLSGRCFSEAHEANTLNKPSFLLLLAMLVSMGFVNICVLASRESVEQGWWACWFRDPKRQKPSSQAGAPGSLQETGTQGGFLLHEGWR